MIEELKSDLHPDDPRMKPLADESEQLTEEMAHKARMESHLREQAEAQN